MDRRTHQPSHAACLMELWKFHRPECPIRSRQSSTNIQELVDATDAVADSSFQLESVVQCLWIWLVNKVEWHWMKTKTYSKVDWWLLHPVAASIAYTSVYWIRELSKLLPELRRCTAAVWRVALIVHLSCWCLRHSRSGAFVLVMQLKSKQRSCVGCRWVEYRLQSWSSCFVLVSVDSIESFVSFQLGSSSMKLSIVADAAAVVMSGLTMLASAVARGHSRGCWPAKYASLLWIFNETVRNALEHLLDMIDWSRTKS